MKIHPDEQSLLDRGGRPTLADLLDKMTFSPTQGTIDLNGARMVLARATFGADLQDELIRRFGEREAMLLLLRLGYRNGREDAEFIRRAWPNLDIGDAFTAGTRLHMVTGTVRVETLHNDFDFKRDRFSGDFLWHQSVEATEYQRRHGRAVKPVCWAQTGYAAGYASFFFRKLILYKEVSCAAMGDKSCRVVGKTIDDWGKDEPFVRMFLDEVLTTRAETTSRVKPNKIKPELPNNTALADLIVLPVRRELEQLARTGLSTIITGPEGAGCLKAAAWLHAKRFSDGHLTRVHASSPSLPNVMHGIRKAISQKGEPGQTLIIEAVEELPIEEQLGLIEMLDIEHGGSEKLLVVGISHLPMHALRTKTSLRAGFLHALSILPVVMPALQARNDDIGLFADTYLSLLTTRQVDMEARLTSEARTFIRSQVWPGNLPELRGAVLRAAMSAANPGAISAKDVAQAMALGAAPNSNGDRAPTEIDLEDLWQALAGYLDQGASFETLIGYAQKRAVEEANGNISAAARRLQLSRAKLEYRLKTSG